MKRFCKVLMAAVLLLGASSAFAKVHSDLQLNAGVRINKLDADEKASANYVRAKGGDDTGSESTTASGFCIGLTNYNLFDISAVPILSLGFMESATGYFGDLKGFDFLIGPAVGISPCDIVKLHGAVGLSVGYTEYDVKNTTDDIGGGAIGVGVDIQAKFLPNGQISPLAGFRYEFNKMSDDDGNVEVDLKNNALAFYAGVAVNF